MNSGILKNILYFCVAALVSFVATSSMPVPPSDGHRTPIYRNTAYSFEERAVDLVSRLTLEEKQSLLGNSMAAVPRLGIKGYNVWSEALHGVLSGANPSVGLSGPTSFPNSVAMGSSWDPDLVQRMADAITDEARAIFQTGTKGLTFWSPVVEPVRDPRWGRTGESYGEDPFLAAEMSAGFVRGFMGADTKYLKAVPTAKHYLANNSEFNRHVGSSDIDSRDMREYYLYPYKRLIEEENLPSIMTAYNAVNGVPVTASEYLVDTIARRTYGMQGYVTGDCAAVDDIYSGHYYVKTPEEATAQGLKAGVDSDCGSVYQAYAIKALEQGLISMADIDRALVNMFTIRMRTGEFDPDPMVPYSLYPPSVVASPAHRALAAELATKTAVLLKNNESMLPLKGRELKRIALIGPQADDVELGPYSGRPEQDAMISPYAGIESYLKSQGYSTEIDLVAGGDIRSKSNLLYIAYFEIEKTDGTTHRYDATKFSASAPGITVGSGMGSEEQVRSIDNGTWTAYENIDITDIENITVGLNIPTEGGIVEIRVGGPEGNLIGTINATAASGARVGGVYGASMPMKTKALKLGYNGPQTVYLVYKASQDAPIDEATLTAAKNADVVVLFVGTDEHTATEEADRLTLFLPGNQVDLIKAVAVVNENTVVVMQTLGCVEVEEFKDLPNVKAILWTGYNGQAQGEAIAKVLFGDVNPGGKLNATWFKTVKDLPEITDYTLRGQKDNNGRTLWYFDGAVSYPFGYGLSYTTFAYSNFRISCDTVTPNDKITISVDVTNTGSCDGDEVVQIYMTTPDSPASLERPIKRLKGFQRATIARGQTRTVSIEIDCADLWFWDMDADKMTYDSGRYVFQIGSSSQDIRGSVSAMMRGSAEPRLKTVVADCGQSVLQIGETVRSSATAALTDDSFLDLSKASVVYTSSNPAVASVTPDGILTAKSMGVATIRCRVTAGSRTVEDFYAVKVMPDLNASRITVGGKALKLTSDTQYSFLRKASATVPTVEVSASDPALTVEIEQAGAVPGTAVATIFDDETGDRQPYVFNFGVKSVSDNFGSASLGSGWSWVREDPALWSLSEKPGSLVLTAGDGDIAQAGNKAPNILLQSANTDWTLDTKLTCSTAPALPAQNAGLVAWQDDDNFVKLVYGASFGRRGLDAGNLMLVTEENGHGSNVVNLPLSGIISADQTLYLRLVKQGSRYTAYYSVDGKKYTEAGVATLQLKDIQAGLLACNGEIPAMMRAFGNNARPQAPSAPFKVAFDHFNIRNTGLK
jgi:beta-glucosidase